MNNPLQELRKNEELAPWDRQIHDDLDAAVAEAYVWPANPPDEEILRRLVALNAERAEEEKRGLIRWLRPEFQNPTGQSAGQGTLGIADKPTAGKAKKSEKLPWPKTLAEQAQVSPLRPRCRRIVGDACGVNPPNLPGRWHPDAVDDNFPQTSTRRGEQQRARKDRTQPESR
jgi:hypothetical protein